MKPANVIVCLCDMLRPFELGCYGHPVVRTPHIDRLAAEGVRFELAVTSNPLCTPARSSLISGQYSRTCTGNLGNTDGLWPHPERRVFPAPTIAECFRAAGYETALIGKWHIEPEPRLCGFDHALYPGVIHYHYGQQYVEDGRGPFTVPGFAPDFEMERVEEFLRGRRPGSRPFFLFHNISQPHMPLGPGNTPDRYLKLYDRNTVPLRPNVFLDGKMAHDREWFLIYTNPDYWYRKWVKHEPPGPNDRVDDAMDLRDLVAWYAALTTCLDDQVGRLLRALEENGLAEDTLVVFLSDHGDNLGSHHQWNKQLLIEESIRIPLIFRHPRGLPARVNARHVASVIDVMPSLLDMCGLDIPAPVQGRSLRPLLEGKAGELDNNWACVETSAGMAGLRTPTHTYGIRFDAKTRQVTEDRFLFFDNAGDPYQFRNLAGTGEQAELGRVLRERVVRWHASTPWLDPLRSV